MKRPSVQAPEGVAMIRPHHFGPNPMTAKDNAFQSVDEVREPSAIAMAAYARISISSQWCSARSIATASRSITPMC